MLSVPAELIIYVLIGFYLGLLAMEYEDLVAPIVAHALYDFLALLYMRKKI